MLFSDSSDSSSSFSGSPPPSPPPAPLRADDDLLAALVAGFEHDDAALARMWNEAYSLPGVAEFSAVAIEPDGGDCLICRSPRTVGVEIPCGHNFFHPHCLSVYWDMARQCPICRSEIPPRGTL